MRKTIVLFLGMFMQIFSAAAQQKYALLVGINQYYEKPGVIHRPALQGCVNDALAIRNVLVRRFGFRMQNIRTLLNEGASKQNVVDGLNDILAICKPGDAVVFYFSGHGAWLSNSNQNAQEALLKGGMNQAMVMSDLYAPGTDCLFSDALVKNIFNKFVEKKVIPTAIFDCCFSGKMSMQGNPMPVVGSRKNGDTGPVILHTTNYATADNLGIVQKFMDHADIESICIAYSDEQAMKANEKPADTRSFNLKDALRINDSSWIPRPSEIPNSMFLSLSATNDVEPGLDITDESGNHHGAYTRALLQAIQSSPATISLVELLKKVDHEMRLQQYPQSPEHYQDHARLSTNLIGIRPENFSDDIVAVCKTATGQQAVIDAGFLAGILAGNKLEAGTGTGKITLRVTASYADSAVATVIGGNRACKPGDQFVLTDRYTVSPPLVKVFTGGIPLSHAAFDRFIAQQAAPLAKLNNLSDYNGWDPGVTRNLFFNDPAYHADITAQPFLKGKDKGSFLVFLPVPVFITDPLKDLLKRNQNIQTVSTADSADLVLYLDYTRSGQLVFTWYNFHGSDVNMNLQFSKTHISVANLNMDNRAIRQLALNIENMLIPSIRARSDRWLNGWD